MSRTGPSVEARRCFLFATLVLAACGGGGENGTDPTPVPTVATVSVTLASSSITLGQATTATAVARDAEGMALAGKSASWSSSNGAVASVSSSGAVTSIAAGSTNIVATIDGKTGQAALTVTPPPVTSVELSAPAGVIATGTTLQLGATAKDAGGNIIAGAALTWTTSSTAVATVNNEGLVAALTPGEVTISASSGGHSAAIMLTVRDGEPVGGTVSGLIERVFFTVPEGMVVRVTADAIIQADSALVIAGTLEFDPGVSIGMYAPRVSITGAIRPAAANRPAARLVRGSRDIAAAGEPGKSIGIGGANVDVFGTVESGGDIFIFGAAPSGVLFTDIRISGSLIAGAGTNGTSLFRNGGRGGDVHVGGVAAETVGASIVRSGVLVQPFAFASFEGTAPLVQAGNGGIGWSISTRQEGLALGNVWLGDAGDGGNGGDVTIDGPWNVNSLEDPEVVVGSGGQGGHITLTGAERLLDGSGNGGAGESFSGASGSGGSAGFRFVPLGIGLAIPLRFGGAGGSVTLEGGNGTGGGPGGEMNIRVGSSGNPGPFIRSTTVMLTNVANGGNATSVLHTGGPGGRIHVSSKADNLEPADAQSIKLTNVASGGVGFNGCGAVPGEGTNGGSGGEMNLRGFAPTLSGKTFSGGAGGNGFGKPGLGGVFGLDEFTGHTIGTFGPDGSDCVATFLTINPVSFNIVQQNKANAVCPSTAPAFPNGFTVANHLPEAVTITLTIVDVTGVSGLTFEEVPGNAASRKKQVTVVVQPGATAEVKYHHDICASTNNFTGQVKVEMSPLLWPIKAIPFLGSCQGVCAPGGMAPGRASDGLRTVRAAARRGPTASRASP